jgi:glutamate racemase
MNDCPIGIFDSGVGGLSVFSEVLKVLPNENYMYYGDTAHLPYGSKSKEELINISKDIFDFFRSRNAKAVIMACNTTSAVAYESLKDNYDFKIYPVVQSVSACIANEGCKKIGVLATNATVNSHAYKNEIQKHNAEIEVFEVACPEWVSIVENSTQYELSSIGNIRLYFNKVMENNPDKIILGCTHYPYLKEILTRFAPEDMFINPATYLAEYILKDLTDNDMLNVKMDYEPKFYVSSDPWHFQKASELFYRVDYAEELPLIKEEV